MSWRKRVLGVKGEKGEQKWKLEQEIIMMDQWLERDTLLHKHLSTTDLSYLQPISIDQIVDTSHVNVSKLVLPKNTFPSDLIPTLIQRLLTEFYQNNSKFDLAELNRNELFFVHILSLQYCLELRLSWYKLEPVLLVDDKHIYQRVLNHWCEMVLMISYKHSHLISGITWGKQERQRRLQQTPAPTLLNVNIHQLNSAEIRALKTHEIRPLSSHRSDEKDDDVYVEIDDKEVEVEEPETRKSYNHSINTMYRQYIRQAHATTDEGIDDDDEYDELLDFANNFRQQRGLTAYARMETKKSTIENRKEVSSSSSSSSSSTPVHPPDKGPVLSYPTTERLQNWFVQCSFLVTCVYHNHNAMTEYIEQVQKIEDDAEKSKQVEEEKLIVTHSTQKESEDDKEDEDDEDETYLFPLLPHAALEKERSRLSNQASAFQQGWFFSKKVSLVFMKYIPLATTIFTTCSLEQRILETYPIVSFPATDIPTHWIENLQLWVKYKLRYELPDVVQRSIRDVIFDRLLPIGCRPLMRQVFNRETMSADTMFQKFVSTDSALDILEQFKSPEQLTTIASTPSHLYYGAILTILIDIEMQQQLIRLQKQDCGFQFQHDCMIEASTLIIKDTLDRLDTQGDRGPLLIELRGQWYVFSGKTLSFYEREPSFYMQWLVFCSLLQRVYQWKMNRSLSFARWRMILETKLTL